jgi:hypothetical protein
MAQIRANREQPITRPGQVERVLCKFGVGPDRDHHFDRGFMPEDMGAALEAAAENAVPFGLILIAEQSKAIKPGQMVRDTTQWPENYSSIVTVEQRSDGGGIELSIALEDDSQASRLMSELRACGFAVGLGGDEA